MFHGREHELYPPGSFVKNATRVTETKSISSIRMNVDDNRIPKIRRMITKSIVPDIFEVKAGKPTAVAPLAQVANDFEIFHCISKKVSHGLGMR